MKIALYLGSFNPFHNGHLEVVKQALNDFGMDKVIIVPTMQNPWKREKVLDIDKRKFIIYWSIKFNENFEDIVIDWQTGIPSIYIDLIEKELIPPYYSYATLHALKNKYYNAKIFVLCGEDTIKDIPNWMNGGEIIKDYDFLVSERTNISSTEIRNRIKNKESIEGLVSSNILKKIEYLYGN